MSNDDPGMSDKLRENIARLTERQRQQRAEAPFSERLAGRIASFTGSMRFVVLHLVVFAGWIAGNVSGLFRFDPQLVVLAMAASVEAIFLSTFILMSQNRMQAEADRRADLDLHINLLAEHELTKLAAVVEQIAGKLGLSPVQPALEDVKEDVEPVEVLDTLDEQRREKSL